MRIVISNLDFGIGGGSSHALKLGSELRSRGHWVAALVLWPIGTLYEEYQQTFDQLVVLPRGIQSRRAYLQRIVKTVDSLNPAALINNEEGFVQGAFVALHSRVVTVTVLHGVQECEISICCAVPRFTDWAVGVSPNATAQLRHRMPPEKIVEIPVGVSCLQAPRQCEPRSRLRLAYVGRVVRVAKNLGVLEKIVTELSRRGIQFHLSVIGEGEYLPDMRRNLAGAEAQGSVSFLGCLSPSRVAEILHGFDILLLTSTFEGTPHAVIEAMAAGVVPVCSRITGSTDRLVEHGRTGFLCSTHAVDEYCAALQLLACDHVLRHQIGLNAQGAVLARYSMESVASAYLTCIEVARAKKSLMASPPVDIELADELKGHCAGLPRFIKSRVGRWVRRLRNRHMPAPVSIQGMHKSNYV